MVVFLGEVRVSNNKIKRSRKFENIFTLFLKPWLLNKPLWPFKSLHIAKVLSAPVFLTVSCSWSYKASLIAFKPTLGVWHDDTVMILLAMASLIIMMQSDTLLLSKTFFISNPNLCNVNLYPLSHVQMHHVIWFPEEDRGLRFFWTLIQLLHWILLLEVATFSEAILNFFWCGVSWIDDLVGPHLNSPTLPWAGNFTTLDTKNLLRTVIILWLTQIFMAACLS